jgi:GT2 family glycosyltransferase
MTSLDIVIVNWNAGEQLQRCLLSVSSSRQESFYISRVVVIDNASSDGSTARLVVKDLPVEIIRNSANRGFAAACNQAARSSKAEYLLFLNPDVVIERDSLEVPIACMQRAENVRIGICGIQLLDSDGVVSRSCARFPRVRNFLWVSLGLHRILPRNFAGLTWDHWDHTSNAVVDHVIGAFYLVRRNLFEALGMFDERFFVYLEDLDFSYRASEEGWGSYYLVTTRAMHRGGGCSDQIKATRLFYSLRSRILYAYKHFSVWGATFVTLGTLLIEPLTRIVEEAFGGSLNGMNETLQGYAMLWRALPVMLRTTNEVRRDSYGVIQPL